MNQIAEHAAIRHTADERYGMDVTGTAVAADDLKLLIGRFGASFETDDIEWQLNTAVLDLVGSIAIENLPEMAMRLAIARMQHAATSRAPATAGLVTFGSGRGSCCSLNLNEDAPRQTFR